MIPVVFTDPRSPKLFAPLERQVQLFGIACLLISGLLVSSRMTLRSKPVLGSGPSIDDLVDARLQQAASSALQDQEGTILIIAPHDGRIRTVLNQEMAFTKAFAPGSTIKPFAALAAMRTGIITRDTRALCREKYSHEAFQTVCSHPRHLAPLDPAEAIAYSCNYFFGRLGERLDEPDFRNTLNEFGFGKKTGINANAEATGTVHAGQWHSQYVLGAGEYVEVTPLQLLVAYTALVNGGSLLTPCISKADDCSTRIRTNIRLTDDEREVILRGLRGAMRFGTAERSGLNSIPLYVLGKTGTATPVNGFRTQGWFVGFSANVEGESVNPTLGVLVFLKRGHGVEAAEVARKIFEEFARANSEVANKSEARSQDLRTNRTIPVEDNFSSSSLQPLSASGPYCDRPSVRLASSSSLVRLHLERENTTRVIPLEEYILGVVSAEGSMETEIEALKALAVASRTYVARNLGRHADDGYDFCNTTHCQLFLDAGGRARDVVRRAIRETEGEVMRDRHGNLVDSYFSASCGGETANIATLWGAAPRPYLRGVRDEYCETMPHSHWTDVISAKDLLRAVRSDPRTDIGNQLHEIVVGLRDETGRAERITIVGQRRLTASGWDFKIIVGRALGWNLLKSSRFQISHAGSNYVFRGSGFGHGLGLCQEGAHVMAERGLGYHQILNKYFPGVSVSLIQKQVPGETFSADLLWPTNAAHVQPSTPFVAKVGIVRRRVASEHFRISYATTMKRSDAEYLLQLLEATRKNLLSRPSLPTGSRLPFIEVFANETTGDFVGRTGLPPWAAAGTKDDSIELQPLRVLMRRGILETTLRHELVHKLVDSVGNGSTARWLSEGLALNLAGEGPMIARFVPRKRKPIAELEKRLTAGGDAASMRELYAAAYAEVRSLIESEGEAVVWQRIRGR